MRNDTIFQALVQKIKKAEVPAPELPPKFSAEFETAFTKCAVDQGCQYDEVSCMLADLSKSASSSWYESKEKTEREKLYEEKKKKKTQQFITG